MNALEVSTVVSAPRADVYDFLVDFTGYGQYSAYVKGIEQSGDGGANTEYAITVSWWKLHYTARSEVTDTDRPERIDWRLVGDVDARGHWRIEPVEPGDRPAGQSADEAPMEASASGDGAVDPAHRVVLRIGYDPSSVSAGSLSLPPFVPIDAVVDRVAPHLQSEAESIVEDVVADLEGRRRDVELTVRDDVTAEN